MHEWRITLLKKIKHELNYLELSNFIGAFIFVISLIPSIFYSIYIKLKGKKIWLICEDKSEARDNGICFFSYLNSLSDCNIDTYYAIDYSSPDYSEVNKIGKVVRYGSVFHWVLYLCSEFNISSQKNGRPDAAVGYVLERLPIMRKKFIFLQHGITLSYAKWLFYNNSKFRLFICGAKPEYEYVKANFGYPDDYIAYLGFSRFDAYLSCKKKTSQIVLMPSWREWISSKNEFSNIYEDTSDFTNTQYYKKYQELLNSDKLINLLKNNNLTLIFYPHRNMQKYLKTFSTTSSNIIIADKEQYNIRKLLMESSVMITDYSSVALDFAYMKKPVIYYQFDEARFREAQYQKGYFDYRGSGLGVVTNTLDDTINLLHRYINDGYNISGYSSVENEKFFSVRDDKNSERIYEYLLSIRGK